MISRLFVLAVGCISLLFSTLSTANETALPEGIKGSLCIVRADDRLVLVNEILTKQISLPGGTISSGEDPKLTAQRETWEETGLVVTVGDVLGYSETAVMYDCVSDSDVIAYDFNNALDAHELPIWFAPHYGVEVSGAMLLDPSKLKDSDYRYPEQWPVIKEMYSRASNQSVTYVPHLIDAAPQLNQTELNWITGLQQWVSGAPAPIKSTLLGLNLALNQLTQPLMLIFLFPILFWRFGKEFTYKVFFALTVTSILSLVAQQGFALPRPHVYIPALELAPSYGYSFPSLPIAVWFTVGTIVLLALEKLSINRYSMSFLGLMFLVGLTKFYSGSAFILDMIVGALLGALVAWHIIRLESKPDLNVSELLSSKGVWIALSAGMVVLTVIWPIPTFTAWLAVVITASGLVMTFKPNETQPAVRDIVSIVVGLLFIYLLISYIGSFVSYSGIMSLVIESVRYPILMLAFVLLSRKFVR
ncbi:phosphatase PAP2 family protein [Vibrio sp. SCSIO 43135]|uniref:bifunctional NUDIX hydrolase/phosphatase PAP2 family protein n=1 Tax=Vibrio sp. SCSIO 43135 TaxID=2819096 RepID=UPI002074CA05|nr:phosphatase PAP2 family protein [Vibrio sp. SCSIO 43135]USD42440.1 phosphatase PAP2 family protein [Vibrio sp. SCSIO 43135]